MKKRILVLGGGFAGLWSAIGAARQLDHLGVPAGEVGVTLVNRDGFHAIRVRNYEADLDAVRVPLDEVLAPIGVERLQAEVEAIDPAARIVRLRSANGPRALAYDRLVVALGSELARPAIPGLAEHAFDIDTFGAAGRLQSHLASLPRLPASPGRRSVVVVGAGLTGIETVAEMPARLRSLFGAEAGGERPRVLLVDHLPRVGSDMGDAACRVIEQALAALGVEVRAGVGVAAVDADGLILEGGERIDAATVVWCAGMRAHPLTAMFPVARDRLGRLPVDAFMKVQGVPDVFAAGDCAWSLIDGSHASVMSCQHSRPMGRFAGHNVVCDLLGGTMLPLEIDWYVTVLDLGPWGALYTQGWERQLAAVGAEAKKTKETINRLRIYPPRSSDRREILDAAAPIVQPAPALYSARGRAAG